MSDADPNDAQYAVEVDGDMQSEHVHFADAIKAGLVLRDRNPNGNVKVRDLSQACLAGENSEIAA